MPFLEEENDVTLSSPLSINFLLVFKSQKRTYFGKKKSWQIFAQLFLPSLFSHTCAHTRTLSHTHCHTLTHKWTHTHTHACHPSPSDNCIRPFRVRIPPNLRLSELQKSLIHCLIGAKYDRKDDKLFFSSNVEKFVPTFENFSEAAFGAKSRTAASFNFFFVCFFHPSDNWRLSDSIFLFVLCTGTALFSRPRRIWLGRRKKDLMP